MLSERLVVFSIIYGQCLNSLSPVGECLACPSGKWKLFAYKMCNNSIFSMLVNFCMLVILISPLLSVSQCYTVNGADAPLQVFVILSCVWCLLDRCLFLFAMKWEINLQNILKSYIPNSLISDNGHYWCIGGILSVLIILINQVVHLFTSTVYLSNLCKGFLVVRFPIAFYNELKCITFNFAPNSFFSLPDRGIFLKYSRACTFQSVSP